MNNAYAGTYYLQRQSSQAFHASKKDVTVCKEMPSAGTTKEAAARQNTTMAANTINSRVKLLGAGAVTYRSLLLRELFIWAMTVRLSSESDRVKEAFVELWFPAEIVEFQSWLSLVSVFIEGHDILDERLIVTRAVYFYCMVEGVDERER